MNINLVTSAVKANKKLAAARDFDINIHLQTVLDEIGSTGIETIQTITAVLPSGAEGDVNDRTAATAHNYYPTVKALILPSNLVLAERIFFGTTEIYPATMGEYLTGTMASHRFFASGTGELYLSWDLVAGDIITIQGRFGITNFVMLPDFWLPYVKAVVMTGLFKDQFPDEKEAQSWFNEKQKQWRLCQSHGSQVMARPNKSGRLL